MCGICGKIYFNKNKLVANGEIKKMTDVLSHRGPDDQGIFIDKQVGLGHRRLSIIDLSPLGHQPMSDAEGKIWLVHNGEIYNFLELKKELEKDGIKFKSKTDTEVIIYLYKKYGIDCLKHLRGMFAFAIWDKEKQQLFLARDRVGKKPLKYYFDNNCFIFASELKAILKNPEVKKEPDFGAIDEYFTYQYVPHPKTGFKNIYKLPPAHYLIIKLNPKEIRSQKYWELNYSEKLDLSEKEWEEKITEKLTEAVRLRLVSDVPLGAHLSGGIDSSLIVGLMALQSKEPIKTFSIGFKESEYNELPFARLVAKKYKTNHLEFIIEPKTIEILDKIVYHYEEPYADSSALPSWYISELTKKYVTVALNGDGGDENFAGYTRYNAMKLYCQLKHLPFKKNLKKINQFAYQITKKRIFQKGYRFLNSWSSGSNLIDSFLKIVSYFNQEEKNLIYTDEFKQKIQNSRWHSFIEKKFKEAEKLDWLDKLLYVDINSNLADDLLVKVDIASMAHSLEIRSPFLDHEFLELTAKMPSDLKMKGHNKKYLLKKIAEKYLPEECIKKQKQGFSVPLEHWFRKQLFDYLKNELLDKKFLDFGFKKEGIEKMLSDHKNYRQNYAYQFWTLLFLKKWLQIWFE
ncbi:asparagine synthase (glutamine-hydrolyzing) [bacterium (Candidatus Gribaldobacteria) CG07_land_8_20_14_0_80_33_18]|uniref:asparagine synthase (glutamine-hydrolyzing) n=1 Tax=bacterium (Candidatus Gribaldobacteria) CG07_land_8_20_14_0_80_33_18 TaxID=2014272 RepID=A0A2M6Z4H6_9BACT|nr:MAG: asparagine synthase (glutamine-hydrolyzing) [bacterium (Candidatus Gribaldobacteria) CG10_big_fil_rev_8_21_14_0_10_33_41]PIU47319.1 MAG: asparagine synthase (glutamine-hydrolyzing) [bacterium (Candidatus Gribaldobacteria) CG07_land_8_20_14_0_80_33_18]PJA00459.1 MAG: asparagine synthase (glutamine-hydrolyzing) [bacterium (Candidatus Gribaldobacteria) CG_4_10_14_0_2_um_filter_33_15]